MRRYDENGRKMVIYATEELAALQRLPGAGREMTDAEITTAALADPDTVPPSASDTSFTGKTGREALAELFPPETVEDLLTPRRGRPKAERPKIQFTARFDADIVEHFRSTGKGWQVRMEEVLRKAIAMGL
ncbi:MULTISPECIES: BrnA antitoxin family protein [unclassified Desulfovibrio]|uniref:BrnA antitoxin family protein n=1 Tax=unclassified Desulfovibrio TaxID=2593640 RepID=UPI0013EDFEE4|nr:MULTISPECIES: BrnA antitoxin family protein [unclassified Desulfovibrio]